VKNKERAAARMVAPWLIGGPSAGAVWKWPYPSARQKK